MPRDPDAPVVWPAKPEDKRKPGGVKKGEQKYLDTDGSPVPKGAKAEGSRYNLKDPEDRQHLESVNVRAASLIGGVHITWLSQAFRIDPRTTRKRLAGLKPIGIGTRGEEIYDFVDAATYLAPPQRDKFARWIGTLRTSDLPTQLQDSYWAAMRKRQIWEQNAGELWKTDDVEEVLGEVFKGLKSNMQLWVDTLDGNGDMPEDQRTKLQQMIDGLQNEMFTGLISMVQQKRTPPSLYDPEVITNSPDAELDEDLIG